MPARFSACHTLTALPVSEPRAVRPAQAQGFDMPTATVWETGELCDFCTNAEFGLGGMEAGFGHSVGIMPDFDGEHARMRILLTTLACTHTRTHKRTCDHNHQ